MAPTGYIQLNRTQEEVVVSGGQVNTEVGIGIPATSDATKMPSDPDHAPELVVATGHQASILAMDVSEDGQLLATGGDDHFISIWSLRDQRQLLRIGGHEKGVSCVQFSPDGRTLATASYDETVRLWRVADGKEQFVVPDSDEQNADIPSVAFINDGKQIVVTYRKAGLVYIDVQSGERVGSHVFNDIAHFTVWKSVVFRDSLICVDSDRITRVDVKTGGREYLVNCEMDGIPNHVSINLGSNAFAVGAGNDVCIFDLRTGKETRRLRIPIAPNFEASDFEVSSIAFSEKRSLMAVALQGQKSQYRKGFVRFFDSKTLAHVPDADLEVPAAVIEFLPLADHMIIGTSKGDLLLCENALTPIPRPFGRVIDPVTSVSCAASWISSSSGPSVQLWDVETGKLRKSIQCTFESIQNASLSNDGRTLAIGGFLPSPSLSDTICLADVSSGNCDTTVSGRGYFSNAFFFDGNDHLFWFVENSGVGCLDRRSQRTTKYLLNKHDTPTCLAISDDGTRIAAGCADGAIAVWDVSSTMSLLHETIGSTSFAVAFADGANRLLAGNSNGRVFEWDVSNKQKIKEYKLDAMAPITKLLVTPDTKEVVACVDSHYSNLAASDIVVWNRESGMVVKTFKGHYGGVMDLAWMSAYRRFVSAGRDGTTRIWDWETGTAVCSLIFQRDAWLVVAPDGRFDVEQPESLRGIHWALNQNMTNAVEPEAYMREYFEPRLLARLLHDEEFMPVRPLQSLNRTLPMIKISSVEPETSGIRQVLTIVVASDAGQVVAYDQKHPTTDVCDLRLFRDGQLVGQWPEPSAGQDAEFEPDPTSEADMRQWRELNRVVADGTRVTALPDGEMAITFPVRLPHRDSAGPIEFTAYAFNEDRVKSETARFTFEAPANPATTKPRAYLIGMGVSVSENTNWNLKFAANDARLTVEEFSKSLPQYEVVSVLLTSESGIAPPTATRENLRTVLQLLSGHDVPQENKAKLSNADQLQKVTPNDLVMIAFSGHGYTDLRGTLHLLPYDVGSGQEEFDKVLPRCISSGDLAAWLRDIDAGELVLILDACHSAAAGAPPGFKPGPLGGRGLAQLAYDKGMRVLAASQADDVALESEKIQHGLLTYALIRDGLEGGRAAPDDELTLGRLLAYSADRVPVLYEEVLRGEVKAIQGRQVEPIKPKDNERSRAQRPELFDYGTRRQDLRLHR